jgi:dihydropteroate synthase
MGVVNVTPDSFYDGGRWLDPAAAAERALALEAAGADVVDIGGESSRPGSAPVPAEEEIDRVIPVIEKLRGKIRIPLSIDTWKAAVARFALSAGAEIINDISALSFDPEMAAAAAASAGPLVLMHIKGTPRDMQESPSYGDVVEEIGAFFRERIAWAKGRLIAPERVIVDPGIGFGKTVGHNLEILRRLPELARLGRPVLIGPSRKSFLGALLDRPPEGRLLGTAAAVAAAILGGAHIVRVHDVREMRDVAAVTDRIMDAGSGPGN